MFNQPALPDLLEAGAESQKEILWRSLKHGFKDQIPFMKTNQQQKKK